MSSLSANTQFIDIIRDISTQVSTNKDTTKEGKTLSGDISSVEGEREHGSQTDIPGQLNKSGSKSRFDWSEESSFRFGEVMVVKGVYFLEGSDSSFNDL